jgi:hypothetical protein
MSRLDATSAAGLMPYRERDGGLGPMAWMSDVLAGAQARMFGAD